MGRRRGKNRNEKARQARIGHRGHVSESAHSLEAGSNFLAHEKNESASVTRRLIFFVAIFWQNPAIFVR
ncbi:MAG: hypothetical protein FWF77_10360 [Defluviitaleaceae bacterium]|nr:hypothetical protein [Defluviitaleaceae bacterium]